MDTIEKSFSTAIEHHQQGQLQSAERIYRQILSTKTDHAGAWHLLGVIAHQVQNHSVAIEFISQSLRYDRNQPTAYNNLGGVYRALHRHSEAAECFQSALMIQSDFQDALINLGHVKADIQCFDEAIDCYRQAIELNPRNVNAYINLAGALRQSKQELEAIDVYRRALSIQPDSVDALFNLANTYKELQRLDEAVELYQRTLQVSPDLPAAFNNLGVVFRDLGNAQEAVNHYRKALQLQPDCAETHNNLGVALQDLGLCDQAIECYRQALQHQPGYADAYNNLGIAFSVQGNLEVAVECLRKAIELNPAFTQALGNLGIALKDQGKLDAAADCLQRAVDLNPCDSNLYNTLGAVLRQQNQLDRAVACCRKAIALKPDFAEAWNQLGNAQKDQGQLHAAITSYRQAVWLQPGYVNAHSNAIYTQLFCPGADGRVLLNEHREWTRCHGTPLANRIRPHRNDWNFSRKIRIGYVSPDFRNHVVGRNLIPLLREHDHQKFEICCYSDVSHPDDLTNQFRGCADQWRDTAGQNDQQLADQIRDDRIDVLVDLTLHMAHNRLLVFARKPAPVQVTFAGYPGTTGLDTIDYRLTDRFLDPPGLKDHLYSEESVALPDSFWCYDPLQVELPVGPLPVLRNGYISFGCLNNFCKVNEPVLKLWARVLRDVDHSRIVMLAAEGSHRCQALDLLEREGIIRDRVTFVPIQPRRQYLKTYDEIDVGLDTLPYNGHATSLDSYWMGVPVVTLVGKTVVGRAGLSQLTNLDLPELIAQNEEQFVRIATELALDSSRLSRLRATLRDRMKASPLMDATRFARNIEQAYQAMWQRQCMRRAFGSPHSACFYPNSSCTTWPSDRIWGRPSVSGMICEGSIPNAS